MALLASELGDLRDPRHPLPRAQLMLRAIALNPAWPAPAPDICVSAGRRQLGQLTPISEPDYWLWRVAWHRQSLRRVSDKPGARWRLYHSEDGRKSARWSRAPRPMRAQRDRFRLPARRHHADPRPPGTRARTAALPPRAAVPTGGRPGRQLADRRLALPDGRLLAAGRIIEGAAHGPALAHREQKQSGDSGFAVEGGSATRGWFTRRRTAGQLLFATRASPIYFTRLQLPEPFPRARIERSDHS